MRKVLTIVALGSTLTLLAAAPALATKPNPEHKATICHATPPDTAAQGWVEITVDVASVGYQQSGHEDQHDADIIPPYSYTDADGNVFSYPGKGDQAILANGCEALTPSPSTPPPTTPPPTVSPSTGTPPPTVTPTTAPPTVHPTHHTKGPNHHGTIHPSKGLAFTGPSSATPWLIGLALGLLLLGSGLLYKTRRS